MDMKLYPFVLLVGFLLVASVAAQSCTNALADDACDRFANQSGCTNLKVRILCKVRCGTCDSYENWRPGKHIAMLYEGNHIMTWDRLPFDAPTRGEFILYRNERTGMKVHALFTRKEGTRNSVTTAVAAIGGHGQLRLQISVDHAASAGARATAACKLIYWLGNRRLTDAQVRQNGGFGGIAKIEQRFEPYAYKMELRSQGEPLREGARVSITVRYQRRRGCYFSKVETFIMTSQLEGSRGLLGTPDSNIYNEWNRRDGSPWPLAFRMGRYLKPAFDYVRFNWCVSTSSGSLIQYEGIGTFHEHMQCRTPYDGITNFNSATAGMKQVCGAFNFECLHDSISIPSQTDGNRTNLLMAFAETATVPPYEGLNAEPRGIRAGVDTTVRFTVTLNRVIPDLNGFALAELDDYSLRKTGRIISFLSDDGNSAIGDADQFDGVFTKLVTLNLRNGWSKGYHVIPMIKGNYKEDRDDLIFALPDAVRGYSPVSGRHNIAGNDRYFIQSKIEPVIIEVNYIWPENQPHVETATTFLGDTIGAWCNSSDPYLECDCDRVGNGSLNKVTISVSTAFKDRKFVDEAEILMYGVWTGLGSGPIDITAIAKRLIDGKVISGTFLSMSVTPKQKNNTLCATAAGDRNLLAKLKMKRNGKWKFQLEPAD